jgi:hypothetical protein
LVLGLVKLIDAKGIGLAQLIYRTRAIITRGLYIFYPLFGSQKRFFKEVFSENSGLMYG